MRPPRKAMVLGAGFGSRLSPLTLDCPKPLVPVRGRPIIAHLLEQLAEWGVEEVLVNIHHRADRMVEALPSLCPSGIRLQLSHEPEILGTGGALRRMAWFVDRDPFWICNADVLQTLDPTPLLSAFAKKRPLACLWMVEDAGPRSVKVVDGEVRDFRGGGLTFSGVHLASSELLDYLPEEEVFGSVISAYEKAMTEGRKVVGATVPGSEWRDVGTPDQLLEANGGSVVFPGARVHRGAKLDRAIVGPGARVRGGRRVTGLVVSASRGLKAVERKWLPEAEAVEWMPARGSDRSFFRVWSPKGSVVLMRSGEARPENRRFAGHTRFLAKQGVRVPAILHCARDHRRMVVEDLGRTHLLDRLKAGTASRNRADMRKVLEMVARLHACPLSKTPELENTFSQALYAWEHDLFLREFLERHDPEADAPALKAALERVAEELTEEPEVLAHRDLQSTNLLWQGGRPVLIDYQGMRRGPAAYDLASLLADPYVDRDRKEQEVLLSMYNRMARRPVSSDVLAFGAVQRLVQALGAYGRLGAQPETRRFLDYIPAAVGQIQAWTSEKELSAWAEAFLLRHGGGNPIG